jgi:hypothetical protein
MPKYISIRPCAVEAKPFHYVSPSIPFSGLFALSFSFLRVGGLVWRDGGVMRVQNLL